MNDEAYIQGTRDNIMNHKDTTFWIYEFLRCDEKFRRKELVDPSCVEKDGNTCEYRYKLDKNGEILDPECESDPDEIDKWLHHKTVSSRLLNP